VVGEKPSLEPARARKTLMVKRGREGRRVDAVERVLNAYDELTKMIGRSEGACIEEIQAAVEYLLDAVKVARKEAPGLPLRAEALLRAVSGPRQNK
jgi:hypothetical protein